MSGETFSTKSSQQHRVLYPTVIPNGVKKLLISAKNIEKQPFRKYMKVALAYLQESQPEIELENAFESICSNLNFSSEEDIMTAVEEYTGVVELLKALLKLNARTVRPQHLEMELKSLGFREDQASDLCRVVYGPAREGIDSQLLSTTPSLPALSLSQWKLQVATAQLSRPHAVEPVIVLTDKEDYSFSLTLEQFHQLRLSVAKSLQQMESLEILPGGVNHKPLVGSSVAQ